MPQIHELSENLTNQIAAGEVIENPASVVKELVENSIDAGSTRIRIDFVDAGLKEIIVQDNGIGIAKDQIDLAFMRHATSKISNEHDLFKVATLGFRGEALASIAAVSHVEIVTATKGETGYRAKFSAGTKEAFEPAASRPGTKITVHDLFYNTPARLKYLRTKRTEIMKIVDIINRIALGYPQIALTLANEGKVLLRTSGNGKLDQCVANVYGRHIAEKMEAISAQDPDFKISGLISNPALTRTSRSFISLLLNGRYIRNNHLNSAILAGYGAKLSSRHYPVAIIKIEVDPFLVDVNVHPSKKEVRLSKEQSLSRLITQAISETLTENVDPSSAFSNLSNKKRDLQSQLKFNLNQNVVDTKREVASVETEVNEESQNEELTPKESSPYVDLSQVRHDDQYLITPTWSQNVLKQTHLTPFSKKMTDQAVISEGDEVLANSLPALKYQGQTKTYILASHDEDLYLVDQVAAQKRLNYDQIYQALKKDKHAQQGLLTPIVLSFGNLDFLELKAHLDELASLGFDLSEFGDDSFLLNAYPTWLVGDAEENVRAILDLFLTNKNLTNEKLLAKIAQKQASINAKRRLLSEAEASQMLEDLGKSSDPYNDSQGNLILVKISQTDLNKMFKKGE